MPDRVSPEVRSRMMAGIGPANTKPEMLVRRGLHAMGWRYRLHDRRLPGKPDLVFPGRHAVLFVNGCFWHGHDCSAFKWPQTREDFWREKICGNVARDVRTARELQELGWRMAEVWECTLRGRNRQPVETVIQTCDAFLRSEKDQLCLGGSARVCCG